MKTHLLITAIVVAVPTFLYFYWSKKTNLILLKLEIFGTFPDGREITKTTDKVVVCIKEANVSYFWEFNTKEDKAEFRETMNDRTNILFTGSVEQGIDEVANKDTFYYFVWETIQEHKIKLLFILFFSLWFLVELIHKSLYIFYGIK